MKVHLSDEKLKNQSIEMAQKLLGEVAQDYKKALFLACGIISNFKHEIDSLLEGIEFFLNWNQPTKRVRGRPRKIIVDKNFGLSPRLKPKKRLGAPKKYLPEIPNKILAIHIAWIKHKQNISYTRAAKILLTRYGCENASKFVKALAEEAKRLDQNRR